MQRYKAIIAYDGTNFCGFQIQQNGRTVQGELEKALKKMHKGVPIGIIASGRTDAGVHARGQVVHFDSVLNLPAYRWVRAINGLLPPDVSLVDIEAVGSEFHARYDATGKTYKYLIYNNKVRDPLQRNHTAFFPYTIDIDKMRLAANQLIGTHDFTSFCSTKTKTTSKVRTISEIKIEQLDDLITFTFTGSGFLYNMVRILVGTLLKVGTNRIEPERISTILEGRDRNLAGKTAPAEGLYLWKVFY